MTVLGNAVLLLGLLSAIGAAALFFRTASRNGAQPGLPRQLVKVHAVFLILASLLLLLLLLAHDFSNGYVFSYSDRSLPLHFLVSSFYAGQEGSFLFWALCSSLLALVLLPYTARRRSEAPVMGFFMMVQSFLLLLVLVKSPFRTVWDMFPQAPAGIIPADGRGLNPLLQNIWMVIHPPVLFIGFAATAVPYAFALTGLWRKQKDFLAEQSIPWVLFSTTALGLGIILGAYWAYGVLGWGGYWGWDPVENSSLVPWLTTMGLLHTLLAQRRTGKFVRTNYVLAIISFALVVYSTFLTRSGVLGDASVHSFTDPGAGVYWVILAILGFVLLGGVLLLVSRWKSLESGRSGSSLLTREVALGSGTLALALSALVILFGTSLPLFSKTRVEPAFYDRTNLPLAIAMGVLLGLSLTLHWEHLDWRESARRLWKSLAASVALTGLLIGLGVRDPAAAALVFASAFAFFVNLELAFTLVRGRWRFLGGKLAHIGLAVFLLGVLGSGKYSSSRTVALPLNVHRQVMGRGMMYVGSRQLRDGKFAFDVRVESGGSSTTLSPVMFDAGQQGVMRNPAIESFFTGDLYLSPISVTSGGTGAGEQAHDVDVRKGDSVAVENARVTLRGFELSGHSAETGAEGMPVGAVLRVSDGRTAETITPVTVFRSGARPTYRPSESRLLKSLVTLVHLNVGMSGGASSATLRVQPLDGGEGQPETLVVDASEKPFIGLVWGGALFMMVGFVISIVHYTKET